MSIRLIAFDLDGTLLKNDKTVSARTAEALRRAAERGIYLVPSTGRTYEGMPEQVKKLPSVRYIITVNGAEIYDAYEGKVLHRAELTKEEGKRIFAYGKELEAICGCYQSGKGWMEEEELENLGGYIWNEKQAEMLKRIYRPLKNLPEQIFSIEPGVQKIQYYFKDISRRDYRLKEIKGKFPELEISTSLPNNIEINSAEANKGLGLRFLCRHLGITPEECMAFGDGTNDLALLKTAGRGVAMANAAEEVLEATPYHTLSNEEDGVAAAVEACLAAE